MTDQAQRNQIALLVLAGIGAGTLGGALIGLLLGRGAREQAKDEMTETVDDLRQRAEQILGELSQNAAALTGNSRMPQE